ncbi:MAG: ankyrin repeat domain-containing protein [Gemmatimonadaceae bacterium]|nr:ankyrin repeat domain-containing protein [Gemmatimonadaceae bacterium]
MSSTDSINRVVARAIPLLQQSADTWFEKRSCGSCHHQGIGTLAMAMLQERHHVVDTARLRGQAERSLRATANWQERFIIHEPSINQAIGQSYRVLGSVAAGHPNNAMTRAIAFMLAGEQHTSGKWVSYSRRPPLEDSEVTATALSLRALRLTPLSGREREFATRIARAQKYLTAVRPVSTEERVMQLLGLGWAGTPKQALLPHVRALLREQRADGGWAQVSTRASDAYATGQALTVLQQVAGMPASDARIQKGRAYLLSTVKSDGSWHVPTTRTLQAGLPYFESGFPHGKDQFISYAGTVWALMALVSPDDGAPTRALMGRPARTFAVANDTMPDGLTPLHRTAMFGTLAELRVMIANGADVNAASPGGVTPLMAAAHDSVKTHALLDAGANITAAARQGHTALLLATAYMRADAGRNGVAALLLARGAWHDRPLTVSNAGRQTPFTQALLRGDTLLAQQLLDRGARISAVDPRVESPLMLATWNGDSAAASWLLRRGAAVDDLPRPADSLQMTPLMIASEDGVSGIARLLIARGANVRAVDDQGRTALHYAAGAPDRGTPVILDALLAAGAPRDAVSARGETALSMARQFGKVWAIERLSVSNPGLWDERTTFGR